MGFFEYIPISTIYCNIVGIIFNLKTPTFPLYKGLEKFLQKLFLTKIYQKSTYSSPNTVYCKLNAKY